jgi:hypothetical protein
MEKESSVPEPIWSTEVDPLVGMGLREEYEATRDIPPLSYRKETANALKVEGRAYVQKVAQTAPWILKKWFLPYVAGIVFPKAKVTKVEKFMVAVMKATPVGSQELARMAIKKFGIPTYLLAGYVVMAQRIRRRVMQQHRRAERTQ